MAKKLETLGQPRKRTEFSYSGSIHDGVVLHQAGNPRVDAEVFREALKRFAGATVYGGFQEDAPRPGGFGEWLQGESPRLNSRKLTPRHGSFVAAILCAEAGVEGSLDGNAVVLRFPASNQRENFVFVMNVAEITDAEKHELTPGYTIRRAGIDEIGIIRNHIEAFGDGMGVSTNLWEGWFPAGAFEALPEQRWRYFVIAFTGNDDSITNLAACLNVAPLELEIGFQVLHHDISGQHAIGVTMHPGRLFQALQLVQGRHFFKSVSSIDLATIGAIHTAMMAHDKTILDVERYARQVGELKALPHNSPLKFLGYFAILESLLTHPPQKTDPYDSITRQIKKKLFLLDNRWPERIDYTPFGGAKSDTVWSTMYKYRSHIAHGGSPDLKSQDFKLLVSHDCALQLIKETVKSTVRHALEEPQLLVDLRKC